MSVAVLLPGLGSGPLVPSSLAEAVLIDLGHAGRHELLTTTVTVRVTRGARGQAPMFQRDHAAGEGAAVGGADEGGVGRQRVASTVTPVAPWLPMLVIVSV